MKISRRDPNVEMEMNMTPLIDVVFLLIIFFMIITDLTQQDLEELQLPKARSAVPDEPDPKQVRPVLNIPVSGNIIVRLKYLYKSDLDDLTDLERYLANQARMMKKNYMDPDNPSGKMDIPDEPILIRADKNTEFKYIQKVMELCGKEGIRIWKIQLAASEFAEDEKEK